MRVCGLPRAIYHASRLASRTKLQPSEQAELRADVLRRFDLAVSGGNSVRKAAELVGVPLSTICRWRRLLRERGTLEPRSRRPRNVRKPTVRSHPTVRNAVLSLRRAQPSWGKRKIAAVLQKSGLRVSESTVGRIISEELRAGRIKPALKRKRSSASQSRNDRPYARPLRRSEQLPRAAPGDCVQVDCTPVTIAPGYTVTHMSAVCTNSRWAAFNVYSRPTSAAATKFLHYLLDEFPFPIRRIQVDGGSEFKADFEKACHKLGIEQYVLPPNCPQKNGCVERIHLTAMNDLYDQHELPTNIAELRKELRNYQHTYNYFRPHEALDLLSPAEYLARQLGDHERPPPVLKCTEPGQRLARAARARL